jgi:hypothetical protein
MRAGPEILARPGQKISSPANYISLSTLYYPLSAKTTIHYLSSLPSKNDVISLF